MSSDFEVAAGIIQHQLQEALPQIALTVKFVAPTLQLRTTLEKPDAQIIRSLLQTLPRCHEALNRLPIETITIYGIYTLFRATSRSLRCVFGQWFWSMGFEW